MTHCVSTHSSHAPTYVTHTHTTPRYGAHFANLSAGTTYTLTIHDPSGEWSTTWSTSDAAPALHELNTADDRDTCGDKVRVWWVLARVYVRATTPAHSVRRYRGCCRMALA